MAIPKLLNAFRAGNTDVLDLKRLIEAVEFILEGNDAGEPVDGPKTSHGLAELRISVRRRRAKKG